MPGTMIPPDEIWGGIPAKKIKSLNNSKKNSSKSSFNIDEIKIYILNFLEKNYCLQSVSLNIPLLSLNLEAYEISRMLNSLEKQYDLFIDRTDININKLSFNELIEKIKKQVL